MKLLILVVSFTYSSVLWADPITWAKSEFTQNIEVQGCITGVLYIQEQIEIEKNNVKNGLGNIEIKPIAWVLNVYVNESYYIFSIPSPMNCGSSGCGTKLFISRNGECEKYSSPYLPPNGDIGIDANKNLYFGNKSSNCSVWGFDKTKLVRKYNLDSCE